MARRPPPRRGVLLLIVLSLLVLFVLIGVTFIVAAGHFSRTAKIDAAQELHGDPPTKLLDTAMYQILRGTSNQRSSVLGHSLLEDLYGREGFSGKVKQQPNPGITQGHFLTFLFDPDDPTRFDSNNPSQLIPNNFFNGAVLTMVTGVAAGESTRIVAFTSQPRPGLKVEAFEGIIPAVADRFVVNGLPFNGTGAGYNPVTGQLDAVTAEGPLALMPHFAAYSDELVLGTPNPLTVGQALVNGGLDESWDTFDYQNVFLAKVTPGANSSNPLQITPSFHRPFLINYWLQNTSSGFLTNPKVRRQVIMRPTREFHPSFTGSNPAFDVDADSNGIPDGLTNGPWDVDNDGDGIPDSVWIDFGLPPVSGPDGRLYKPLIAPLIVDLDGRLNLNVHGNLRQIQGRGIDPNFARIETGRNTVGNFPQVELLRGNGYGPPDIDLLGLFRGNPPDTLGDPATYNRLLRNRYAGVNYPINVAVPGVEDTDRTGEEPFSRLTHLGVQPNYSILPLYAYGTPTDLFGRGVMFLDQTGNPVWAEMGIDETTDDPYEIDPLEPGSQDNLFTASDLEPILRRYDSDAASLASRLASDPVRVMDRAVQGFEKLVTTHSFDVSTSATVIPNRIRRQNASSPQSNIMEVVADRLRRELAAAGLSGNQLERKVQENLALLIPFEIQRGQKMDVNRLFGNQSADGQSDYVTDDPFEPTMPRQEAVNMPTAGPNGGSMFEYRSTLANDYPGTTDRTDGNLLRNIFARQLYTLMMALTDERFSRFPLPAERDTDAAGRPVRARDLHARRIAQWAINTVDFRDADAIMTPFEYDSNPFNGWDVDGYIGNGPGIDGQIGTGDDTFDDEHRERFLVWGAEHPELIITETLAFHDRRVKDEDVGGKVEAQPPAEPDLDFDQYLIPEGSLFIELYCVRGRELNPVNPANPTVLATAKLPMELYGPDGDDKGANKNNPFGRPRYLQLGRMAARNVRDGTEDINSPIWRIAIQDPSREADDATPEFERFIWFTRRPAFSDGRTYSNFQGSWPQVVPGGYVVVGPRPVTAIGYSNSPEDLPSRQRIILDPAGSIIDTRGTGLAYIDADGVTRLPARPVTTIIAQANNTRGPGCSVSEPLPRNYYNRIPELDERPEVEGLGFRVPYHLGADNGGQSIDEPLDNNESYPLRIENKLATGTYKDHRTALLQRLANPLLPFDAKLNPYITVDSMPIDLTVFNSLATGGAKDPDDQDPAQVIPEPRYTRFGDVPPEPREYELASRERVGDAWRLRSGFDPFRSLWNSSFTRKGTPPFVVPGTRVGTHSPRAADDGELKEVVNLNLGHTLGELNSAFGPAVTAFRPGKVPGDPDTDTSNITNNPATARILQQLRHSFPTLVWNNRPYVSALELMLVPATSQEGLLQEFTVDRSWDDQSGAAVRPNFNPYGATGGSSELDSYYGPFGHLLNFFHSSPGAVGGDDDDSGTRPGANYSRIFDYIEVPSRFVGTRKWYNPEVFQNVPQWRTPFNNLSRFRDPGRININTILAVILPDASLSPEIWHAMGGDYFLPWAAFVESRQGFKSAQLANFPAEVSNPFRAAAGADLVPPITDAEGKLLLQHNVVDATLLRSDLTDADNDGNRHEPLLAPFELASEADKPYINRKRNAYSRYQAYQKLANLVTTHSNVYAVWLTVGYFELEPNYAPTDTAFANPNFVDAAHPDGYRLALERGSDVGQVERQRAFYIIDRSVPVAFQAGVNHNVDRAVLLRRFIE